MSLLRALLISLLLLVSAAPLAAVTGSWSVLGPDTGGSVLALVSEPGNPQVLYTGGPGPHYKSVNGGTTWSPIGSGLPPFSYVRSLALDPAHPGTIYSSQESGVYKSLDGGATWQRTALRVPVDRIALIPRSPQTVYAATPQGLYKTSNGGARWNLLRKSLPRHYRATTVFVDPASPKRIFATIFDGLHGGLYKSVNDGFSWQPIHSGVMTDQIVWALAIDRRPPATLFAGTSIGIFKSTNDGRTWRRSGDPSLGVTLSLALHPLDPNVVYAGSEEGMFRSLDRGQTWTRIVHGLPAGVAVTSILVSPQSLYIGVNGFRDQIGVYRSGDGGSSWALSSRGISGYAVRSVSVDSQHPGTIWVIANYLPYKSVDRGRSWTLIDPGLTPSGPSYFNNVAVSPADPQTVYLHSFDGPILRSRDGGQTWVAVGVPGFTTTKLKTDPQDPDTLWLTGRGIARSTDGGDTWLALVSGGFYTALEIAPSSRSTVYAFGTDPFGLPRFLRTNDGGFTGTTIEVGIPAFPSTLAIDPVRPEIVYTFSNLGEFYRSLDSGTTWTLISDDFREKNVLSLIATPSGALYAGVEGDNVYESVDGGLTWSPLGGGPVYLSFTTLAEDPQDPCRLYGGTGTGIYDRGLLVFTKTGTATCP